MNPSTIAETMAFGLNEAETSAIEALLHAGGLAHPFPQIEKLRPSHFTATFNLDGGNLWAMQHEDSLNADALEDPAHGDGLIQAAMALGDHHTLVGLNTLFIAFADAHANANGVANVNLREIALQLGRFKFPDELRGLQANAAHCGG